MSDYKKWLSNLELRDGSAPARMGDRPGPTMPNYDRKEVDHMPTVGRNALLLIQAAVSAERKKIAATLLEIHSALDDGLGDLDVTYMDDNELRQSHPVQWAACKLATMIEAWRICDDT